MTTQRKVIVAGYGPVGRCVAQKLDQVGCEVTIIEMNPKTVEKQTALGRRIILGDATQADVLHEAGIENADALVLAVPGEEQALVACRIARQLNDHIFIAARTNFLSKGMLATQAGADHVTVEEVVTADAMKDAVTAHLLT